MKQNKLILNSFVNISKQNSRYTLLIGLFLLIACSAKQNTEPNKKTTNNWYSLDLEQDSIPGIGLKKAYISQIKKSKSEIIVAVIDTPFDIEHPVFKDRLFINKNEIPNNQIDDDKNGYVDDIHGWNFLGYENDKSVYFTNYEIVRLIRHLENRDPIDTIHLEKLYNAYKKQKNASEKRLEKSRSDINKFKTAIKKFPKALKPNGHIDTIAFQQPKEVIEEDQDSREFLTRLARINLYEKILYQFEQGGIGELEKSLNKQYNDRKLVKGHGIINDTENIFQHGTQVAGLIAEVTNSKNYIDESLLDVKLMFLCTSAVGDYHNNDLTAAIRYAVDNGASVINLSDSKSYSIDEENITEAIKYAEKNNVLIVTSAGNAKKNTDLPENDWYPKDHKGDFEEITDNLLTIGASTKNLNKTKASFSNYGKHTVDLFAPGSQITVPNGEIDVPYVRLGGTSLASALTSASAAIILTQYPDLKVVDLKNLLMQNGTHMNQAEFSSYSKSGKILNLNKVLEQLQALKRKPQSKQ